MNERAAFKMFLKNAALLENAFTLRLYRFSRGKSQCYLTNYSYLSKEQSDEQKLQSGGAHRHCGLGRTLQYPINQKVQIL